MQNSENSVTNEKRALGNAIKKALKSSAEGEKYAELFKQFGIKGKNKNYTNAIACAGILKAANGDKGWAEYIRDMVGENPKNETSDVECVVIIDDIKA